MSVLLTACDAVVAAQELQPEYAANGALLKTFCNLGAQRVAKAMGCLELDLPNVEENADFLHDIMEKNASGLWTKTSRWGATIHAMNHVDGDLGLCPAGCPGGLGFASMTGAQLGEAHGHIATVRPEAMRPSTSAGGNVPMLANVGRGDMTKALVPLRLNILTRPNWNCRESEAFPIKRVGPPSYFAWRPA